MVDFAEIPLELQLREANCRIQSHLGKGRKYTQFFITNVFTAVSRCNE